VTQEEKTAMKIESAKTKQARESDNGRRKRKGGLRQTLGRKNDVGENLVTHSWSPDRQGGTVTTGKRRGDRIGEKKRQGLAGSPKEGKLE